MKKSISINIHGVLFHIEEDGYDILQEYLESIKKYFKAIPGDEEIVADIEARIAEKFQSLLGKGKQVISKKDVTTLISEMGTVDDFENEKSEDSSVSTSPSSGQPKRLFRNPEDKIIAGVCSGIAAYFGIDPLFVRLAFVVLTFFYFGGVAIYLLLWLLMPEAKTTAQKVEMQGRPVTLETLSESLKGRFSAQTEAKESTGRFLFLKKTLAFPFRIVEKIFLFLKSILKTIWRLCKVILFPIGGIFLFLLSFGGMLFICVMAALLLMHADGAYFNPPLFSFFPSNFYPFLIISGAVTLLIPLLFIAILGISLLRRKFSLSGGALILLLGLWFCGIFLTGALGISVAPQIVARVEKEKAQAEKSLAETKTERVFPLESFTGVNISGNYRVEILAGPNLAVSAAGNAEEIAQIRAEVRNDVLTILPLPSREFSATFPICLFCSQEVPQLRITLPVLEEVKLASGVRGKLSGFSGEKITVTLDSSDLEMEVTGGKINLAASDFSKITLHGTAEALSVKLTSSSADLIASVETVELEAQEFSRVEMKGEGRFLAAEIRENSVLEADDFQVAEADLKVMEMSRGTAYVSDELRQQVSRDSILRLRGKFGDRQEVPSPENSFLDERGEF